MNFFKTISIVTLILSLSSCAIPTKKTCLGIDWHEEGLRDGLSGLKPIESNFYAEECKMDHNITLNETNYMEGYEKGISSHCTIQEARQYGLSKKTYFTEQCPLEVRHVVIEEYYRSKLSTINKKKRLLHEQNQKILQKVSALESKMQVGQTIDINLKRHLEEIKKEVEKESTILQREYPF